MNYFNDKLTLPIIQGGMGVGISLGELSGAVAKEGGMGVISTANPGYREVDFWKNAKEANERALQKEIEKAQRISKGNGMIAINAMVATADYENSVRTAIASGVDAVISGAGLPLNLPLFAEGSKTLLAPIVSGARAASLICRTWQKRYGRLPDFVVLEGSGAGGHLGFSLEELEENTAKPLEVLFDEVKEVLLQFGNIPLVVAGGISTGDEVAAWLRQGAAGVQIATRFIATHECDALQGFKDIMVHARQEDVSIVKSPVGMPGRALHSPLIERVARGERIVPRTCTQCLTPCKPGETPYCITKALIEAALGNWETGLFFCGENVGNIKEIVSVKELLTELTAEWSKS